MSWSLHRHDARHISGLLEPESVDLIVTSPPYFALRSYRDECAACGGDGQARPGVEARPAPPITPNNNGQGKSGLINSKQYLAGRSDTGVAAATDGCPACNGTGRSHYDGQVGSEATPGDFVDTLIACTADWLTVLRPGGSLWVNLGDKYAGSGGHNNNGLGSSTLRGTPSIRDRSAQPATRRNAPDRYNQHSDGIPAKSLMGLPWRYALRCVDELGLILRAEIIWSKPNGLPESVTDRVRRSHEQWFHFTREGRYFAAIDEVREPQLFTGGEAGPNSRRVSGNGITHRDFASNKADFNPLGKVPGSVWSIPSEPLDVPAELGVDHFAAFPSELPRRIILGWSPSGYCTACGEARRAVVDKRYETIGNGRGNERYDRVEQGHGDVDRGAFKPQEMLYGRAEMATTITGYACACPTPDAPTRPAVVLDPFAGTGTVPAVAHLLGRHGIGVDLSRDYLRLAEWRCTKDRALRDKVLDRSGIPNPDPPKIVGQLALFGETPPPLPYNPPIRWRDGANPRAAP